jgi:hypothetical protein
MADHSRPHWGGPHSSVDVSLNQMRNSIAPEGHYKDHQSKLEQVFILFV